VNKAKSIESADFLHQERATAAFRNWKERFDPSISHPNACIPLHPNTVVRQEMPLKPEIFHGRDHFVEDIAQSLLQEETSRICILGPGGMGISFTRRCRIACYVVRDHLLSF